jgi:catechol 2,3-dioxygenase-like lactoylglutathione lyase family enzyme
MEWKLEVVTIPVTDLDRAKDFYAERLGFNVDIDHTVDGFRFLQLTPNGSKCSVHLRRGSGDRPAGSVHDIFLVVRDVRAARDHLVQKGVDASDVQVFESGGYRPARRQESLDMVGFVFLADPDGNSWIVQQIPSRD